MNKLLMVLCLLSLAFSISAGHSKTRRINRARYLRALIKKSKSKQSKVTEQSKPDDCSSCINNLCKLYQAKTSVSE